MTSEFDRGTAVTDLPGGAFAADLDPGWVVGGGINGGYLLAVVGNAVRARLATSGHVDPFSVSAHYLSASVPGPATVETEVVRAGGRFSTVSGWPTRRPRTPLPCRGASSSGSRSHGPSP